MARPILRRLSVRSLFKSYNSPANFIALSVGFLALTTAFFLDEPFFNIPVILDIYELVVFDGAILCAFLKSSSAPRYFFALYRFLPRSTYFLAWAFLLPELFLPFAFFELFFLLLLFFFPDDFFLVDFLLVDRWAYNSDVCTGNILVNNINITSRTIHLVCVWRMWTCGNLRKGITTMSVKLFSFFLISSHTTN